MRCLMILAAMAAGPGDSRSPTVDRVESILSEYADSARFDAYRADDPGPAAADEQIRAILDWVRFDLGLTSERPTARLTSSGREARVEIVELVRSARRDASRAASVRPESWPRKIDRATYREPAPLIGPSPSDPPPPIDPTPYPTPSPMPAPMPLTNQQPIMYYLVTAPAAQPAVYTAPAMVYTPVYTAPAVQYVAAPRVRCGLFGCRIR
jgi:hypothetical protein